MNSTSETNIESWQWEPQPAAAAFVQRQLDLALQSNHWAQSLQSKLRLKSGTRLIDWLDHLILSSGAELSDVGYEFDSHRQAYVHTGGLFPQIVVDETLSAPLMAIKVESIEEFVSAHSAELQCVGVEGAAGAVWRMAFLQGEEGSAFRIVERCGYAGLDASLQTSDVVSTDLIELSLQSFRARLRSYEDPEASFLDAKRRFDENAQRVGPQRACCLFFQSEREFWQFKNDAAKIQLQRQSRLGLGWANHDHHTYRCSRQWFASLISFLEGTGFHCRERFYAGRDAGWGAQVLEHSDCGITVFADVDMSAEELAGDFAHQGLSASDELGTVGMWCALHGDSFVAAGMHHLECQFDFESACNQLSAIGVECMRPFTNLPFLKQAFTKGQVWMVPEHRLARLVQAGAITEKLRQQFAREGVIGSHLEILERNDGFKGFNQTGISQIILETNPANVAD